MKPAEIVFWVILTAVLLPIYAIVDWILHLRKKGRVDSHRRKV